LKRGGLQIILKEFPPEEKRGFGKGKLKALRMSAIDELTKRLE
jgi:hypothetical protein